eukprot:2285788-Lingulodinium_polyedra.AAC.1
MLGRLGERIMLSVGGPGTGQYWTAFPRQPSDVMGNLRARFAMLQRVDVFCFAFSIGVLCSMPRTTQ